MLQIIEKRIMKTIAKINRTCYNDIEIIFLLKQINNEIKLQNRDDL